MLKEDVLKKLTDCGLVAVVRANNAEEAIKVFKSGARMAKGTTTEKGLVESYFANPFGPVQMKESTDLLIDDAWCRYCS